MCGKGGSRKSTLVTLLANRSQARNLRVLVIGSDESNLGLFRILGFEYPPLPLMGLVGEKRFVKGRIKHVDFVDEHTVVMEREVRL